MTPPCQLMIRTPVGSETIWAIPLNTPDKPLHHLIILTIVRKDESYPEKLTRIYRDRPTSFGDFAVLQLTRYLIAHHYTIQCSMSRLIYY